MRIALGSTATTTPGGSDCWDIDALLGICTKPLTTATGAPLANVTPPAPAASYSAMVNYNPDVQAGQIQGAAGQQSIDNTAVGGSSDSSDSGGTPAATPDATCSGLSCVNTSTWVLLGIAATLGVILTMKR
jgi:hypothetical protein